MTRLNNYEMILNTILKGSLSSEYVLDPDVLRKMIRKDNVLNNLNAGLTNEILQALHKKLMSDKPGKRENEDLKQAGIEVYYKTIHFITEEDFNYILPMLVNMIEAEKNLNRLYPGKNPAEENDDLKDLPSISIGELKDGLGIANRTASEGADYCIFTGIGFVDGKQEPKKIAFKIHWQADHTKQLICLNPIIN